MIISALTTVLAIGAAVAVIGYRVFVLGERAIIEPVEATATLRKG